MCNSDSTSLVLFRFWLIMKMEYVEYIQSRTTNCYTFSTNDNMVDWSDATNSSVKVLDMIAIPYPPDIVYRQLNDTNYQWCGPQLYFAEYFAKFTRTR